MDFSRLPYLLLVLAATSLSWPVAARTQAPDPSQGVPTFGATTELVYVRFHIEKKGHYIADVAPSQLRVLEDGAPREIALVETPSTRVRTVPPDVTLALDVSSSVMDERLLDEKMVRDVLFASLSEQARVGLCAFGGELRCFTSPTRDADAVLAGFREAMQFAVVTRRSGTRLYDSIAELAAERKEAAHVQRAIVVFSDGLDTLDGSVKAAIQAVRRADVRVYSITLAQAFQATGRGTFGRPRNRTMFDYKKLDLARLAGESGGRNWEPGTLDEKTLASILREIGNEITMEIVVGYQPAGPPDGREHKVKVELLDKSLGKIRGGKRTLVR